MSEAVKRSIVIPVFNEIEVVPSLFESLEPLISQGGWEVVFVDDGSTDGTYTLLRDRFSHWKGKRYFYQLIKLQGRWGQHRALACGMDHARGDVIIVSDADLQIGLDNLPLVAQMVEQGYDLVSCVRKQAKEPLLKKLGSNLVNWLSCKASGIKLSDYGCPTNGFSKELVEKMKGYPLQRLFLKPLAASLAEKVGEIEVSHRPRTKGKSHYSYLDLFSLTLDFVTSYSRRLFQRLALVGLALWLLSLGAGGIYVLLRLMGGVMPSPPFQVLVLVIFGLSLQMVILGILGDFVVRIYRRLPPDPLYEIEEMEVGP